MNTRTHMHIQLHTCAYACTHVHKYNLCRTESTKRNAQSHGNLQKSTSQSYNFLSTYEDLQITYENCNLQRT